MDREVWRVVVHGVAESAMTEWLKRVAEEVVDCPLRSGNRRLFGVRWWPNCHSDSRQPSFLHSADLSQQQAGSGYRCGSLEMQQALR